MLRRSYLLTLVAILCASFSFAQVTADFMVNTNSGCLYDINGLLVGATVNFTNTSSGATTYDWDFGNGNNSTLENPTESFTTAGTFTVILTASDGTTTDTHQQIITVYENPVADLLALDSTVCINSDITFNDQSTLGDGSITDWTWSFGDGSLPSNAQDPTHQYSTAGVYTVSLEIMDINGCESKMVVPNNITVVDPPVANFSGTPTLACVPPLNVTFTNNSSSGLIYTWDFGVGTVTTTSSADTVVTYNSTGSYDVALTVTDPIGCSTDTLATNYIIIEEVFATFAMSQDTGCPDVLATFPSTGTIGANTYFWDYGDGTTPANGGSTGSHNYALPGDYDVALTVTSSSGMCSDDTTISIHIEQFTADIAASGIYGCSAPFTVSFTDQSVSNASAWAWEFGDNTTSTQQNPVHDYAAEGLFIVTLTATSNNGCVDDTIFADTIELSLPEADFTIVYDSNEVCFPSVVTLTDNSSPDNLGTLTQWQWDFGNDSAIVTNATNASVTMTYAEAGEFDALLTVTSSPSGCIDTLRLEVQIGDKLNPIDSITQDTSCAIDPVEFVGSTDADSLVDVWEWFGPGGLSGQGQVYNHQYQDTSAIGWNTDTLVVEYNGCYDTTYIDSIFIVGPIVENIVADIANCTDSTFYVSFSATYIDTTTYMWIFGDGDTLISHGNLGDIPAGTHNDSTYGQHNAPTHVYSQPGDYFVQLLGWNQAAYNLNPDSFPDSCAYETNIIVRVRDTTTTFTVNNVGCPNTPIGFTVAPTFIADNGDISYTWQWGDGSPDTVATSLLVNHQFGSGAYYHVTMSFSDINGCFRQRVDTVRIIDPTAIFDMDTNQVCVGGVINFTDQSISDTAFASWLWNFGDGGFSFAQDTAYTFNSSGNYTVQLTSTDSAGCSATASAPVIVIQPTAILNADSLELCAGESTQFNSSQFSTPFPGTTINGWDWDFGDSNTSTQQNPNHTYTVGGTYDVVLTVTDNRGCTHIDTNYAYIDVQNLPEALFEADQLSFCYPDGVTFTDTSLSPNIVSQQWDLGVSTNIFSGGSVYQEYNEPGSWDIMLVITSDYGCIDTLIKEDYVSALGPTATFEFTPDTICNGDSVLFELRDTNNISSFQWIFGDGGIATEDNVWHQYNTSNSTYIVPSLQLTSFEGCVFTVKIDSVYEDSIYVHHVNAAFSALPLSGCAPLNVAFNNSSIGYDLAYNWDFDEGQSGSTLMNPQNEFEDEGSYNVILTITEQMLDNGVAIGCTDLDTFEIIVLPDPDPTITPDTLVCAGSPAPISAFDADAISYNWSPDTYLNTTSGGDVTTTPQEDVTYTVTVTNSSGCQSVETVNITVFDVPLFYTTVDTSNTIFIGDTATISVLNMDDQSLVDLDQFDVQWTPMQDLDCYECPQAEFTGLQLTGYEILISDVGGICSPQLLRDTVDVLDEFGFDLPDIFTPNGDGQNDTVFVRGYGIKELHTFEIYNRWGERVYENPGTKKEGWDGTFMGKPQNMDTYVAIAVAENFHGETFTIKKHITLYR